MEGRERRRDGAGMEGDEVREVWRGGREGAWEGTEGPGKGEREEGTEGSREEGNTGRRGGRGEGAREGGRKGRGGI